ncbi:hypothetical protein QR680_014788 [Steinernema hermaphroditum]|uniref:Uncharacterized protein n=1 Tax=Steinernema hermaphroditum TaxID=289476 RepID=A0AA39IA46_9BILA|nr:hypothetical protein QR680_014788 [Steinernema hermaphroditum]
MPDETRLFSKIKALELSALQKFVRGKPEKETTHSAALFLWSIVDIGRITASHMDKDQKECFIELVNYLRPDLREDTKYVDNCLKHLQEYHPGRSDKFVAEFFKVFNNFTPVFYRS